MIKLTLRQMQYFETLVQTLHFGRAAVLCGISQPALSAQIADMEEKLGCKLFDRSGRNAILTLEALTLLPLITRALAAARDVEEAATTGRSALEGRFRLGIIPTVAPYLLPSILPQLRQRYPELRLELREAVTDTLAEETALGSLDAFIAALPLDQPGLTAEALFEDRFFLAVPRAEPDLVAPPVPPESPVLERLMLLEEGHCLREQALQLCGSVRPTAMANYGATSLTTLLQMVGHGFGVTLVPEMAVAPTAALPDLRVVPFAEPMPSRIVALAWRRNGHRQAECKALAEMLKGVPAAPAHALAPNTLVK